jgi:6-pyruvoyltetrahydropterin/6-carboxytetrahydropterin synthase
MLSISKKFRFEAAHAIFNYNGPCKNIHGHSYILWVSIQGQKDPETQMLLDFKLLKNIVEDNFVKQVDHAIMLNKNHPESNLFTEYVDKTYWIEGEPTAENLIEHAAGLIQNALPKNAKLSKLKLYETESSYVEWEPDL